MELSAIANPYFLLAGAGGLGLISLALAVVCWLLRRQILSLRREARVERERTQGLERMPKEMEELRARLEQLDERTVPPGGWSPVAESVHLNRRGQVLKLHRGGHSACEIASNLGISEGEVQLTLKLHGLVRGKTAAEAEEFSLIPARTCDRNTREPWVKRARA